MADLKLRVDVCRRSVEQMIYSFLEDKKSYIRPEMMGKKEGGKISITVDRHDNIKGKLKNYFIPFVGSSTISEEMTLFREVWN